jgi:c-di-GMP-binding flagellar brake protein YcgR
MQDHEDDYGGPDRRKYPRLRAAVVEYSPVGEEDTKEMSFTKDVGAGGICIIVSENIEQDAVLSLKIYLPDSEDAIDAMGKVVWVRESEFLKAKARNKDKKHYDLGLEFVEIEEKDREKIYHYVRNPSSE